MCAKEDGAWGAGRGGPRATWSLALSRPAALAQAGALDGMAVWFAMKQLSKPHHVFTAPLPGRDGGRGLGMHARASEGGAAAPLALKAGGRAPSRRPTAPCGVPCGTLVASSTGRRWSERRAC